MSDCGLHYLIKAHNSLQQLPMQLPFPMQLNLPQWNYLLGQKTTKKVRGDPAMLLMLGTSFLQFGAVLLKLEGQLRQIGED